MNMVEYSEYRLGSLCNRFSSGKGIPADLINETGKYPVIGGNGLRGYTDTYNFDGECAVIGRQGAYCGNVQFFSGKGYMTEHAVVTQPNSANNAKYLTYKLNGLSLGRFSGQAAQPGLSVTKLARLRIEMPPKWYQDKVAGILYAYDTVPRLIPHSSGDDMADRLTAKKRSWNMSRIKGKDTSIEVKVRKYLFSKGFRFRKNDKRLPGKPDVVLPKYHTVIFVHGCFWHRHPGCRDAATPKTRTEFWLDKFEKNVTNDRIHCEALEAAGWKVITLWECDIKKRFDETMDRVVRELNESIKK